MNNHYITNHLLALITRKTFPKITRVAPIFENTHKLSIQEHVSCFRTTQNVKFFPTIIRQPWVFREMTKNTSPMYMCIYREPFIACAQRAFLL